ncbi:MAG TPA: hypothetical protein VL947_11900, partial [Cytophagales bacterium]|nr:hypothetical protein [Cytophagales bacterium]
MSSKKIYTTLFIGFSYLLIGQTTDIHKLDAYLTDGKYKKLAKEIALVPTPSLAADEAKLASIQLVFAILN